MFELLLARPLRDLQSLTLEIRWLCSQTSLASTSVATYRDIKSSAIIK